jgi:hypothetical protein
MADWLVDVSTDPRRFPVVQHRHPNGTLVAVRDHTPVRRTPIGGPATEAWTYICACGEVYTWERRTA